MISKLGTELRRIQLMLSTKPSAQARIIGSTEYRNIRGTAYFYQQRNGVYVITEANGLPKIQNGACQGGIFAYHIHEGSACVNDKGEAFESAGGHYNPNNCEHPFHAGDMPPLFSNNGYAFSIFLTDRFDINEIIGKSVIIHDKPDDFTTQPSGNSGSRIACGIIKIVEP